ncbi:riboflavin biosynthesis pyrimidine reductase [Microbacterium sp. W4I4]|uniref:pyrimidine reductase family protein n=1 Tax=Microbacterium sp. W4I4 TaxID=3042295 RepID=UPI0027802DF4|nr:pyrimidine reductase family protein [Microbacterium sp. W4I4]MDQ0613936.1 riboflavin biosynthesis pyrimidine reductase [Microbacterium sp. W4I4]
MSDAAIDRVWPDPASDLDDAALLKGIAFPAGRTWLRMNFVASLDGAATRAGRSGGLGDAADRRLFDLLRWEADVILLGAGTARIEGYGGMRLSDEAVAWRTDAGLVPQPAFALVSRSLDLDPGAPIFTDAPVRPIVYTVSSAPAHRRAELADVADVVDAGDEDADGMRIRQDLAGRGLYRIHSEGGPHLFGAMLAVGAVDALHLTLAPSLEVGSAGRIARGVEAPVGAKLASVLRAGDELLLHYRLD